MKKFLALGVLVAGLSVLATADEANADDFRRSSGHRSHYGNYGRSGISVRIGSGYGYGYGRSYPGSFSYSRYGSYGRGYSSYGSYGRSYGGYGSYSRYGGYGRSYGGYCR